MYNIKELLTPVSLPEAVSLLSKDSTITIISGGTDLLVKMRHSGSSAEKMLSTRNIAELNGIYYEDGKLCIGASTTFTELSANNIILERFPILAQAAVSMGGPQVRNAATIGGNICNGATSADSAPALFALNAELELHSASGVRVISIVDFYKGPGAVKLAEGEILRRFIIDPPSGNWFGCYEKFATRKAMDISMLGCAVVMSVLDGVIRDIRISLGTAAPTPIRCYDAERIACGNKFSKTLLEQIAKASLNSASPRTSWRASKEFRSDIIVELIKRCANESFLKAGGIID